MGAIYEAKCTCGYESAELTVGCGFQRICWNLATCERCRRLVSVRADGASRCPPSIRMSRSPRPRVDPTRRRRRVAAVGFN